MVYGDWHMPTNSTEMTEARAQEIALALIKLRMTKEGIRPEMIRDAGNAAKDIGISTEEMRAFIEFLIPEVLGTILKRKRVSLKTGD